MKSIPLSRLILRGELAMRANLNYSRLETGRYWPETIFDMDSHAWPADWEGRTMLALVMHAQATKREPAFLEAILARIPERLNEKGYLGPVYPEGVTHEQAMAGHSWMIRALCEYICWRQDTAPDLAARAKDTLLGIVRGLYLPQAENYTRYPIDEDKRFDDPRWILSHKQSKTKTHAGTSDCGCAFIALDGATAAYEVLQAEALRPLIEAMIKSFDQLPREELHVQTHATLSGTRGVLRWYRLTGDPEMLKMAIRVFDLYKTQAWTDHYANYNWFGLPRWTEPCAVVDSFLLSQELWEATGEEGYLRDAHHILYNALAHAERANGPFGTDLCVGAKVKPPSATGGTDSYASDQAILFAKALTYEVFWCCNMRGGDGLSRAASYSFYTDGDAVTVPFYHACTARLPLSAGDLVLREEGDYPLDGRVAFHCLENQAGLCTLRLFAPEQWSAGPNAELTLNGKPLATTHEQGFLCVTIDLQPGDVLSLDLGLRFAVAEGNACVNNSKDHFSFRHGPMMLGIKSVLPDAEAELPAEHHIDREAPMESLPRGRYATHTRDGERVVLQPLWGKENLTEPLDVYQVLFAK